MRFPVMILLALVVLAPAFGEPTAAQWELVKKYDGQTFSTKGLKKVQTQANGWSQYEWTEGRFLWEKADKGWVAIQEKDGTEVYRYDATNYSYHFADGRIINSDPVKGTKTWAPMAGDPAPDFDLTGIDGTTKVKLSSLRGQVVFLDFWASWCGPCQEYLPGTEALHQKFKDKGLRVFGINIEGDNAKARTNAAGLKLTFPSLAAAPGANGQYNWSAAQIRDYQVEGIPHGVLIDKRGIIRARDTVFEDEALVGKLLAE